MRAQHACTAGRTYRSRASVASEHTRVRAARHAWFSAAYLPGRLFVSCVLCFVYAGVVPRPWERRHGRAAETSVLGTVNFRPPRVCVWRTRRLWRLRQWMSDDHHGGCVRLLGWGGLRSRSLAFQTFALCLHLGGVGVISSRGRHPCPRHSALWRDARTDSRRRRCPLQRKLLATA